MDLSTTIKMNNKYINIDLDDPRTAKVADVISNKTSKKIISYLADKEASETEISKDLKIPANTVNYNIKKLLDAGLIEKSKEHFWSVKGKKIPMYRVAKKSIVISPKSFSNGKQAFVSLIVAGVSALGLRSYFNSKIMETSVDSNKVQQVASEGLDYAGASADVPLETASQISSFPEIWMWFFLGALFVLVVYFVLGKLRVFR
jgi:DNA-binding transcriptional ArsR family regulator